MFISLKHSLGVLLFITMPSSFASQLIDGEKLLLAVTLNGSSTDELLSVYRHADGSINALAGELRHMRIKIPASVTDDSPQSLNSLKGVRVHYDEAAQVLALTIPEEQLDAYAVNLGEATDAPDFSMITTEPAAVLNYGIYHNRTTDGHQWAGSAEALATGSAGIFSTSGLYNDAGYYNGHRQVRLGSYWRYIEPDTIRSYTAGDFVSNALSWNNSVRLVGFQWASAFEQRSDLVTTALPEFSGSAALPSTLDLYINQQRIYSGAVPSGPFDLKSLPYVTGGNVTLVTTDATGRQITTTRPYYYTASLLQPDLLQFSVDVGAPRFNYGIKNNDYDDTLFAANSLRYGFSRQVTLENHNEFSADGLVNFGAAVAQGLNGYGVINGSWSASRYEGYTGQKATLGIEGRLGGVQMYAGTLRTFEEYFDLARVSTTRLVRRNARQGEYGEFYQWVGNSAQARIIDRFGFNMTPFERLSTNMSYNRIVSQNDETRTLNFSVSRALTNTSNLSASVYQDLNRSGSYGAWLTFTLALGGNVNASAGVSRDGGKTGYNQRISGIADQRQGAIGWGVSNTTWRGRDDQRNAYISYRAPQAQLRAQLSQFGSVSSTELSAEGALLASDSGVFATNRIGDAYTIVKNAGPHVDVMQGGVRMATTDSYGSALLPDIRPYYRQTVSIDPATLPDGWEAAVTERTALSGYRQGTVVDFGARMNHAAIVILHDHQGHVISPGYPARQDNGETGVVGYDGELYVKGLTAHNQVSVDLGSAGLCSARFDYDLKGPVQPVIGPVRCE
ncbi:TPA: fimbrial biogenesis outer membrane usher protein [Klebsiella variicola]|nr:fimbrial biogenesis outer membrane usher protein [Klebsiella variicola]